ncbi:MAG: phosphatase PAP2 family protein, partial [Conexibacter sp.]
SLPVAGGALALTALLLLVRRHGIEGLALLVGLGLTYAGVHITKAAFDRPRPLAPLIDAAGSAYPSGHAAYAICWVAIAVALRHAFPRTAARVSLLAIATAIAIAVGLSRIYLRVHWFSDVAGGWGLGAMTFALTGTVALVIAFLRSGERSLSAR